MAIQKIFRSATPSFRYFFRNGVAAIFMNGRFTTDNKELEDELMAEVGQVGRAKSTNPYIYVDENEPDFDTEALSPLELIKLQAKEEARRELLAEQAAQTARALNAQANISSTSADFKSSLNNTALQQASMGTEVTLQALATSSAQAPAADAATVNPDNSAGTAAQTPAQEAAAPAATGLAARLANLTGKSST